MTKKTLWLLLAAQLVLTACSTTAPRAVVRDRGPSQPLDVSHIPDAVPRAEPRSAGGNKSPYTVLGKTYRVMADASGYRERGIASWYGLKFHGARTSNGEIYDMYGMTAAHKSLPIPTFVEVTNLNNGRKVIVRVNDRGPFHDGRIIDLSYSAAKKLGIDQTGTAPVEVVAIDPAAYQSAAQSAPRATATPQPDASARAVARAVTEPPAPAPKQSAGYQLPDNTYLQAGAFSSQDAATTLLNKLTQMTSYPVFITRMNDVQRLFRVRIGPITDNWELANLRELIQSQNLGAPHVVYE